MKILHLSTSDLDGGAARAAYRLHKGLQNIGATSQMLVRAKTSVDKTVIAQKTALTKLGPPASGLPLKFYPKRDRAMFSAQWFPDAIAPQTQQINPDIVHLHWICNGFAQIETLAKLNKPLVWTLHDMWALTGGCHYTQECDRYTNACGSCPQLKSQRDWDLSRWVWQRKVRAWKALNLTIVSPSNWLAQCAKSSSLFKDVRVEVIPHGLDLEKYQPIERQIARKLLNLPQDKQLVLFGTSPGTTGDKRKGFVLLQAALQQLSQAGWQDKLELVVFGGSKPENWLDLGFRTHYLGQFHDDISLALVYASANAIVVPSTQEAFGQTASEALACGTPAIAFAATGLKDVIEHQQDGYLAKPFEVEDLARGIAWVLEDGDRYEKLCFNARARAEREFTLELQARRYLSLYKEV
ncbi:MAG: glycosyltransferase [Hydrococcus sp. RU_2_2]|nr:glycosyltransferase [Hydrococcus sp. RU_2_2]NJP17915.1 glycosyltransferase [Hydrococcus sp. CRU_1_1]NJQ97243.1 glycosyltransferase [Hydrococcus sp. CSU_1_8]